MTNESQPEKPEDDSVEWLSDDVDSNETDDDSVAWISEDDADGADDAGSADDSTDASPVKKKRTAEFVATVLVGLAVVVGVVAFGLGLDAKKPSSNEYRRSWFEITATFYTGVCTAVVVPVWIPCLIFSAFRGLGKGKYHLAGVERSESPVAFWYVFVMYIVLAGLAITAVLQVVFNLMASFKQV